MKLRFERAARRREGQYIWIAVAGITMLGVVFPPSRARSTPQNNLPATRDEIQQLYYRFDDYYVRGDFSAIEALALPDARYLNEMQGIDLPFSQ